jgi:hypothetical protein
MRNPICPSCKNRFSLIDGFRMFNPWNIKCRKCSAILQGGVWQKIGLFAGFVAGLAIAGFAIWQEEAGKWETSDSLVWFAFSLTILYLACLLLWPRYTFTIKRNA